MTHRSHTQQAIDVENAKGEDEGVDGTEDQEGCRCRRGRQERCHSVGGTQYSIYRPRLSTNLRCVPAGQYSDVRQRKTEKRAPQQQPVVLDALLRIDNEPIHATKIMSSQQPTMILNVKNGMITGGLSCGGKSVKPTSFAVRLILPIRLPKTGIEIA
jgi:hypothetical protein